MAALLADTRFAELREPDNCRDVTSRLRDTETLSRTMEIADFEGQMSRCVRTHLRNTGQTHRQQVTGKTLGQYQSSLCEMRTSKTRAALWKR
jgi:hypothetical protein